jgi:hypothetical protein
VAKNVSLGHNAFRQSNRPLNTIFQQQQEHILTMATPESSTFAFIVNRHPLPSPYLVHMSRMSKTTKKNLDFFKPNVMYLPRTMNFILKLPAAPQRRIIQFSPPSPQGNDVGSHHKQQRRILE